MRGTLPVLMGSSTAQHSMAPTPTPGTQRLCNTDPHCARPEHFGLETVRDLATRILPIGLLGGPNTAATTCLTATQMKGVCMWKNSAGDFARN